MFATLAHAARMNPRGLVLGLIGLSLVWCLGCTVVTYQTPPEPQPMSDDAEYLAGYGTWVEVPPFGAVWRPGVVPGWGPFHHGHWVWSDYGWAWVSYEPFGWLVYHYGYWDYQPAYGWFWIPGDRWSPARVQWLCYGDYAAWAPLPPPNVYWPDPWQPYETNVWVTVNINDFEDEDVVQHRVLRPVPRGQVPKGEIVKHPPDVRHVEMVTQKPVPLVKIEKQEINLRPRVTSSTSEYAGRKNTALKRMVLPPEEKNKVERNQSRVEKEVLAPRKTPPPPPPQPVEKKKASEGERKKSEGERKKSGAR